MAIALLKLAEKSQPKLQKHLCYEMRITTNLKTEVVCNKQRPPAPYGDSLMIFSIAIATVIFVAGLWYLIKKGLK